MTRRLPVTHNLHFWEMILVDTGQGETTVVMRCKRIESGRSRLSLRTATLSVATLTR